MMWRGEAGTDFVISRTAALPRVLTEKTAVHTDTSSVGDNRLLKRTTLLLILMDVLLVASSLQLGYVLRFGQFEGVSPVIGLSGARLALFAASVVFSGYFCELYGSERQMERIELAARIAVALSLAFLIVSAVFFMLPEVKLGRGFLSLSLLIFGLFQYGAHYGFQTLMNLPKFTQRVLILGVGPLAQTIERAIPRSPNNYEFAGFVQPSHDLLTISRERIVGQQDEIEEVLRREGVRKLVVAVTERRGVLPVRELLNCKLAGGVDVIDSVSFYEQATGKLLIENIQPSWFLYASGFRVTTFMRFYKRVLDLLTSFVGMLLFAPLFPLIALIVKLDSPGPVFFKQIRVGERNREFWVYKFRTMRQDAEAATGAVWATVDDPRITRVGNFLRKSRLDEVPQLFNVFNGDMSIVGPRPERPEFVERLSENIPYYAKRHFMKPGVTGWAQVCYPYGASDKDALEKLRYDLYYIKNYSVMLDLIIILETIKVVLFGRGGR